MPTNEEYEFYVAGVQHHNLKFVLDEIIEGEYLILEKEPTNKYDPNAIKILYLSKDEKVEMLGYVPGKQSATVTHFLSRHPNAICEVTELNHDAKPWNQLKVKIYNDIEDFEDVMDEHDEQDL